MSTPRRAREATRARVALGDAGGRGVGGGSSSDGAPAAARSAGDLPVRVIVCHWSATRPVVSSSGWSRVGASAGAACGVGAKRARPSGV